MDRSDIRGFLHLLGIIVLVIALFTVWGVDEEKVTIPPKEVIARDNDIEGLLRLVREQREYIEQLEQDKAETESPAANGSTTVPAGPVTIIIQTGGQ